VYIAKMCARHVAGNKEREQRSWRASFLISEAGNV